MRLPAQLNTRSLGRLGTIAAIAAACTGPAQAALLTAVNATPTAPPFQTTTFVAEGTLSLTTDGKTDTGFKITSQGTSTGVGMTVALQFDVSGFSTVTGFSFGFDLVSKSITFEKVRVGAGSFSKFQTFDTPNDQLASGSIAATVGGAAPAGNLADYLNGSMLSVLVTTDLASVSTPMTISLDFRELRMDVQGTLRDPVNVPEPGALALAATALATIGLVRRRRADGSGSQAIRQG